MLKQKKTLVAFLIIPLYFLVKIISNYPNFIEEYYSNGIYIYISKTLRFTIGWLPFSFGDLVYGFGIIYILRWLFLNRKRVYKDTKNWLVDVFATLSVLYLAFHLFWGFNYYRLPLHTSLNLKTDYTTERLALVTEKLIENVNTSQRKIAKNDTLKVDFPFSKSELLDLAPNGYERLAIKFPQFKYSVKSVKKSLFSLPLTYMGFSGYLNPITNEAQVNYKIPKFKFPTTASHEMAHQLGYAAENEANFIGSLAAINNDNIYFNYSGYAFALKHCLNEVYRRDECLFQDLIADINKGVLKNYQETQVFWDKHQNPLEPIFKTTYSGFLKANNQSKGIESYSYVVALLVNYYDS